MPPFGASLEPLEREGKVPLVVKTAVSKIKMADDVARLAQFLYIFKFLVNRKFTLKMRNLEQTYIQG